MLSPSNRDSNAMLFDPIKPYLQHKIRRFIQSTLPEGERRNDRRACGQSKAEKPIPRYNQVFVWRAF
jgi:hypothetical protein